MEYRSKAYAVALILIFIIPVVGLLSYNIYIDPFQIIHKDFEKPDVLLSGRGTDRYQHAGVINQYDINAFIVGHSHVANYLPSKVTSEFGIPEVFTLTMDGAPIYEQTQVARYALKQHDVKWVLWGFSARNLLLNPKSYNKKLPINKFLYDDSRINDLDFFVTFSLKKYHEKKISRKKEIISSNDNLHLSQLEFDQATAWFPRAQCSFNRPGFIAKKIYGKKGINYNANTLKKLRSVSKTQLVQDLPHKGLMNYEGNLKNNILPLVITNPDTQFNFIISVYPKAVEQKMKIFKNNKYLENLKVLRYFVKDMNQYSNVKIFAFGLEEFSDDLRLFKDPGHFHKSVNDYFLERMAGHEGLLTTENIDDYLTAFDKKVSAYRLPDKWNPKFKKKFKKQNYLSDNVARLLIKESLNISDEDATKMSLIQGQDELPRCARKLKKDK